MLAAAGDPVAAAGAVTDEVPREVEEHGDDPGEAGALWGLRPGAGADVAGGPGPAASAAGGEGPRFENLVAMHLLKAVTTWRALGAGDVELHYLRDNNRPGICRKTREEGRSLWVVSADRWLAMLP